MELGGSLYLIQKEKAILKKQKEKDLKDELETLNNDLALLPSEETKNKKLNPFTSSWSLGTELPYALVRPFFSIDNNNLWFIRKNNFHRSQANHLCSLLSHCPLSFSFCVCVCVCVCDFICIYYFANNMDSYTAGRPIFILASQ